jgi:hypothetical protein
MGTLPTVASDIEQYAQHELGPDSGSGGPPTCAGPYQLGAAVSAEAGLFARYLVPVEIGDHRRWVRQAAQGDIKLVNARFALVAAVLL